MPQFRQYTKRRKDFTKGTKPISSRDMGDYISPEVMAESLQKIISFILSKVPYDKRNKRKVRIKTKILELSSQDLSTTNLPEAASIGQALTIVKNMLFGKDPNYINQVRQDLMNKL